MTRITKAALAAQLEAAHVSYEALATKYEALKVERDNYKLMFETEVLRSVEQPAPAPAPRRVAASNNDSFRIACQRAREMAMTTGRCVRVG